MVHMVTQRPRVTEILHQHKCSTVTEDGTRKQNGYALAFESSGLEVMHVASTHSILAINYKEYGKWQGAHRYRMSSKHSCWHILSYQSLTILGNTSSFLPTQKKNRSIERFWDSPQCVIDSKWQSRNVNPGLASFKTLSITMLHTCHKILWKSLV